MWVITNSIKNDTKFEILNIFNYSEDIPFYTLSWGVVITITIVFIIAPYLTHIGIKFLKDQPLNKQCIMNHLCRDGAKLQALFISLWAIYVVGMKFIQETQNEALFLLFTQFISYANESLFFTGILLLCLIAFLRLYTTVYQILDPLEDWFGLDENMVLNIIRCGIFFIVILIVGLISLTSATPIIYYRLTEQDLKWNAISWQSRLKFAINIIFCIFCAILFVAGTIYQHRKESMIKAGQHYEVNVKTSDGDETKKGNEFNNYVTLVSMLYLLSFLLILMIILLLYLNVLHLDIWWGITSLIGIQGVVMPIVFTVFNKSFRHYCWRQIKNDINDVFCYIHTFTSVVKQHNAQVSSLQ